MERAPGDATMLAIAEQLAADMLQELSEATDPFPLLDLEPVLQSIPPRHWTSPPNTTRSNSSRRIPAVPIAVNFHHLQAP